jgi:hypothetical protein
MDQETPDLVEGAARGDGASVERRLARDWPDLARCLARRLGGVRATVESGPDSAQSVCLEAPSHSKDERLRLRSEAESRQWLFNAAELELREERLAG